MPTARPRGGGRSWPSCKNGKEVADERDRSQRSAGARGLRFYQASFGMTGKLDGLKVAGDTGERQPAARSRCDWMSRCDLDRQYHRHPGRIHSRLFHPRQPGLQALRQSGEPGVPPAGEEQGHGRRCQAVALPRLRRSRAGREDELQLRISRHADGLLHRTGSFARARTVVGVGRLPADGRWDCSWRSTWCTCGCGLRLSPIRRGKLVLWIGGQANKNRDRFEQKFNDVVDDDSHRTGERVQPRPAPSAQERNRN